MKKIYWLFIIFVLLIMIGVIIMFNLKNKIEISDIKSLYFGYSTGNMIYSNVSYDLNYEKDTYVAIIKPNNVSNEDAITVQFKNEDVEKIKEILKTYKVQKWNGFNKSDPNVLDGNSFSFSVYFKNNTNITASGYMMYPENYVKVKQELDTLFLSKITHEEL